MDLAFSISGDVNLINGPTGYDTHAVCFFGVYFGRNGRDCIVFGHKRRADKEW